MPLPRPFMVLATQNPIDTEGTYPLPEAQLDRFLLKIDIGYPTHEEEDGDRAARPPRARPATSCRWTPWRRAWTSAHVLALQRLAAMVRVDERCSTTRCASCAPRATGPGSRRAPGRAAPSRWCARRAPRRCCDGRDFVTPDDVKRMRCRPCGTASLLAPDAQLEGRARRRAAARARSTASRRRACEPAARMRAVACAPIPVPRRRAGARRAGRGRRVAAGAAGARTGALVGAACWLRCCAAARLWRRRPLAHAGALWRRAPLRVQRRLPRAFALGVATRVSLSPRQPGQRGWHCRRVRRRRSALGVRGLPQTVDAAAGARVSTLRYTVDRAAARRGRASAPAQLRWAQPAAAASSCCCRVGRAAGTLRVYPNFAAVARYAWLAGDRRLSQIGIKTYRAARQRHRLPAAGRLPHRRLDAPHRLEGDAAATTGRSCASSRTSATSACSSCSTAAAACAPTKAPRSAGGSHFDQALNALMLLAYVALKEGDEVGALTFGNPPGAAARLRAAQGRGHARTR